MASLPFDDLKEYYFNLPASYQGILLKLAKTMLEQSNKGKAKYGTTIDENTSTDPEYWLNHCMEEMADFLVYFEKYKQVVAKNATTLSSSA